MGNLGFPYKPHCFQIHKKAELPEDMQDACDYNLQFSRFAIADGATQSFFPKEWADLLVGHFCQDEEPLNHNLFSKKDWLLWLEPIQQAWRNKIKEIADNAPESKYYITNGYVEREAALATFVGLELKRSHEREISWKAMVVGDSCLFLVQESQITSYLMQNSQEFDHYPALFSSLGTNDSKPQFIGGTAKHGDFFVLATDALAKWILKHDENKTWPQAWESLRQMTEDRFEAFIESTREEGQTPLEDDDVTLMIIPVGEEAKKQLASQSNGSLPPPPNQRTQEKVFLFAELPKKKELSSFKALEAGVTVVKPWHRIAIAVLSGLLFISIMVNLYFAVQLNTANIFGSINATPTASLLAPPQTSPPVSPNWLQLSAIYSEPSESAKQLFASEEQSQAQQWTYIQTDFWVISKFNNTVFSVENEGIIYIQYNVKARLSPSLSHEVVIGQVLKGVWLQKTSQLTNESGTWYQVRINGFMLR